MRSGRTRLSAEIIPDEDAIHRHIDFPRMYNDAKEMIWENVFQFPGGEPESVVWGKHAPTLNDVHRLGREREATIRRRNPDMRYIGFISSAAGPIRHVKTAPGHGFSVVHAPREGIHHAEISYRPAGEVPLKKSEKSELKFALRQVFGALRPQSCE